MLSHVALGVYLVFSTCLAFGELRSSAVPGQTPQQGPVTGKPVIRKSDNSLLAGVDSRSGDRQVAEPGVNPDVKPAGAGEADSVGDGRRASEAATNVAGRRESPSGSPVPEPKIFALVGIGLLILSVLRRRIARSDS